MVGCSKYSWITWCKVLPCCKKTRKLVATSNHNLGNMSVPGIGVLEYGCCGGVCSISSVLEIWSNRTPVDEDMHSVWEVLQSDRGRRSQLNTDEPLHDHPLSSFSFQSVSIVWRQ